MLKYLAWDPCVSHISKVQDRQFTYNVTWRPVRATIFAVEKQYVLYILSVCVCVCVCVCVRACVRAHYCLSYPACKSHLFCAVLYCHLWPAWFYFILHIIS